MAEPHQQTSDQEAPGVSMAGGGPGGLVLLCDHASNYMPPEYARLGLNAARAKNHYAWDPGALALAEQLGGPLVAAGASRLLVDCNRALDAPDLIPAEVEDGPVPGNARLDRAERARRVARFHAPYHAAIDRLLTTLGSRVTALVAIHSFTPVLRGVARPWRAGVLFGPDRRLADPLIVALAPELGAELGVNQPYAPEDGVYYTLERHASSRGLPNVMIEIRNDELTSPAAVARWAERLGAALTAALTIAAKEI